MRVAVTGASGFIGRHVLAELNRNKVEVFAVTRDSKQLPNLTSEVRIVEMDISLPSDECFARIGCPDILIHLAWDGLPNYNSLHHFESELPKQYQFLKTLVESGLKSILATGTCLEYGMQSGPLSEEVKPCPSNPYGCAKDYLRQQLEFLKSVTPFKLIWGRLFYMYGEGQPGSSLYSMLKDAVLRGDKTFNMSGGEQLRDYLSVTEVARSIVKLALSERDIGTVNICSGNPISVRRLVEQWLEEYNWEMQLNLGYFQYPDYEPLAFWGNVAKLATILKLHKLI